MIQKGKLVVFLCSLVVILYGLAASFYGRVVAQDAAYKELAVFMDVLKKIEDEYVESPDMAKAHEGAMRGLMEALDPYSSYLSKGQLDRIEKRKALGNAGVGMVISKRGDVIYAVSVERDGPADQAGIRSGDYIIALDGEGVDELNLPEVESLLLGAAGSKVKVTVYRGTRSKPADFELVRRAGSASAAASRMLEGGVGLLSVSSLADDTVDQIRLKLKTIISAGAQKIILDLRDCADGAMRNGADLANLFVKDGVIALLQDRGGQRKEEIRALAEKHVTDLPLVVLINNSSAGAAEVAAGALGDLKRASIVGERSFGMGSIQKSILLKSGGKIILSVAKYCTPAGKVIQDDNARNAGIRPNVEVPDAERRQDLLVGAYYDQQDDAVKYRQLREKIAKEQLDRAREIVLQGPAPLKKAA